MKLRLLALSCAAAVLTSCAVDDTLSGDTDTDITTNVLANDFRPSSLTAKRH